jgi:hypothetical protein
MNRFVRGSVVLASLVMVGASLTAAADPAYLGKWKFNQAKSAVTGDTVTIGPAANGMMQFSSQGFTYTFKTDGKEYPTPDGGTTSWKATSSTVWDVTNHMSGKPSSTYHLALTGDMLAVSGKMMKPDGGSMDFSASYKRVSGGPGFAGKWMSTEVKMPVTTMEIAAAGANGVTIKSDGSPMISCQFDGKDTPGVGMMAGSKSTFACRKVSDSSIEITAKLDGKPMYVDVYTVSADGKTLTDSGTPVNAKSEPYKLVFDKMQ